MLSISNPGKGASDGARYYLDERTDYYPVGERHFSGWFGRGARRLQLQGTVERSAFYHVLNGHSPDGTQPLVQNARDPDRQCYWDLTFSAPKSVSVLWALAPAEARTAIEQAHRRAVERTLAQVEATVGLTRRGPGGRIQEPAALVFATFQEYASRALDPQIHTHAVLVNLGLREDGTTGALKTRDLFRAKLPIGAVYQNQLARELRQELGLTIEPDRVGYRVVGVPPGLCRKLSKRRQAIEQALEDRGRHNAVAAKVAALDTRPEKPHVVLDELFSDWHQEAQRHGWGPAQARRLLDQARQQLLQAQPPVHDRNPPPADHAQPPAPSSPDRIATPDPTSSRPVQTPHPQPAQNDAARAEATRAESSRDTPKPPRRFRRTRRARPAKEQPPRAHDTPSDTPPQRPAGQSGTARRGEQHSQQPPGKRDHATRSKSSRQRRGRPTPKARRGAKPKPNSPPTAAQPRRSRRTARGARRPRSHGKAKAKVHRHTHTRQQQQSSRAERTARHRWMGLTHLLAKIVHVEWRPVFPHAPRWNPALRLKTPVLVFNAIQRPRSRWGKILWRRSFLLTEWRVQKRRVFPNAPRWNPFRKLEVPALRPVSKLQQWLHGTNAKPKQQAQSKGGGSQQSHSTSHSHSH